MGGIEMQAAVKFHSETKAMTISGKKIPLESLTPILPPKERERRKRDVEKRLYDVFSKYDKKPKKQAEPNRQHCSAGLKVL